MKNKKLLDSFAWTNNTGVKPDCEYVEVVTVLSNTYRGKSADFVWGIYPIGSIGKKKYPQTQPCKIPPYDALQPRTIIKYREISEEECDEK